MAGPATPMALRVAVPLGLPDRLRGDGNGEGRRERPERVTGRTRAPARTPGTLGVVERTDTGYRTTEFGAHLRADAGNGLHNLVHLDNAGGRSELALVELAHGVTTGQEVCSRRYGQDFWADLAAHPRLRESFDRQVTGRFAEQIPRVVAGFDWARFTTLVDVGGGQGTLLAAILTAHPHLRGHLADLPPTAADARRTFTATASTTGPR